MRRQERIGKEDCISGTVQGFASMNFSYLPDYGLQGLSLPN